MSENGEKVNISGTFWRLTVVSPGGIHLKADVVRSGDDAP